MPPPHRFDARPPAWLTRRAPEHHTCRGLPVACATCFARARRRPAPHACMLFRP